jgi:hypothetical protein
MSDASYTSIQNPADSQISAGWSLLLFPLTNSTDLRAKSVSASLNDSNAMVFVFEIKQNLDHGSRIVLQLLSLTVWR